MLFTFLQESRYCNRIATRIIAYGSYRSIRVRHKLIQLYSRKFIVLRNHDIHAHISTAATFYFSLAIQLFILNHICKFAQIFQIEENTAFLGHTAVGK